MKTKGWRVMNKHFLLCLFLIFSFFFAEFSAAAPPPEPYHAQKIFIPYTSITGKWWTGLAITNESSDDQSYYLRFYDENGNFIASGCLWVDAHAIYTDALQNYFVNKNWLAGHVSIEIIQTADGGDRFSTTLFMGNTAESKGFGFQSFRSEDYEMDGAVMCMELPY